MKRSAINYYITTCIARNSTEKNCCITNSHTNHRVLTSPTRVDVHMWCLKGAKVLTESNDNLGLGLRTGGLFGSRPTRTTTYGVWTDGWRGICSPPEYSLGALEQGTKPVPSPSKGQPSHSLLMHVYRSCICICVCFSCLCVTC